MSYFVLAYKNGKPIEMVVVSHKTSRCEVSWMSVRKLGLVLLQVDPWDIEVATIAGTPKKLPPLVYEARWIGKADMMVRDCLRFEYRKVGARAWEMLS